MYTLSKYSKMQLIQLHGIDPIIPSYHFLSKTDVDLNRLIDKPRKETDVAIINAFNTLDVGLREGIRQLCYVR